MGARRISGWIWLAASLMLAASAPALAQSQGLTVPQVLLAYDAQAAQCPAPTGLSRAIGFAQDNQRQFIEGVGFGLERAAADRGLDYSARVAGDDAAQQAADVDAFFAQRTGAVIVAPIDPFSLGPHLQQIIWAGDMSGRWCRRRRRPFSMHRNISPGRCSRRRRRTISTSGWAAAPMSCC